MTDNGVRWLQDVGKDVGVFGARVATLIDWWVDGIYHERDAVLGKRTDWTNERWIEIVFRCGGWSTFDNSKLTRLVIGAHDAAIRVEIEPCAPHLMRVLFHPRQRDGAMHERHATIEEQIERARRSES